MKELQDNQKTILVTGGKGYIGSHIVSELLKKNYKVISIDNESNSKKNNINKNVEYYLEDFSNTTLLNNIFSTSKVDIVIHLAASVSVEESVLNQELYFKNNFEKTKILIDTMKKFKIKKIVFASTAAVYGNPKTIPIFEEDEKNPINPYGISKLMTEELLISSDLQHIILRFFNVAGIFGDIGYFPKKPITHLIPSISKKIIDQKETFTIYGKNYNTKDGTAIRDYIHVQDLVIAILKSLDYLYKNIDSHQINLGSNYGYSILEIINEFENFLGKKIDFAYSERRVGDPESLIASNKKAINILNWKPSFTLREIIKSDFEWNIKNKNEKYF